MTKQPMPRKCVLCGALKVVDSGMLCPECRRKIDDYDKLRANRRLNLEQFNQWRNND